MSWLKLDDEFVENAKIEPLTDRAFRLHVAALCYCARNLTDGRISAKACRILTVLVSATIKKHVAELVTAGLWITEDEGAHLIKDYLDYNPDARTVKDQRARNAQRQRDLRSKRGDVSDAVEESLGNGARNALHTDVRHGLRVAVRTAAPSPPLPNPEKDLSFPAFVAKYDSGGLMQKIGVGQVLEACHRETDIDARLKVERASKGCTEADFAAAVEACKGPGARDRLAVALATLKKRRHAA